MFLQYCASISFMRQGVHMRCNHAIFCRISIVLVLFLVSGMHALDVANYITETDNSLLWTFEQDGRQVIVLGTVHIGARESYPLNEAIEDLLTSVDYLVLELSPEEMAKTQQLMVDPAGPVFNRSGVDWTKFMTDEERSQLEQQLPAVLIPALPAIRPWFIGIFLLQNIISQTNYSTEYAVESYLMNYAGAKGWTVSGLETAEGQMNLMNDYYGKDLEEQVSMLQETLATLDENVASLSELYRLLGEGDAMNLWKTMIQNETDDEEKRKIMFDNRHPAMLEKIDQILAEQQGVILIAVGAAHLFGPNGLLQGLRSRGYQPVAIPGPLLRTRENNHPISSPQS